MSHTPPPLTRTPRIDQLPAHARLLPLPGTGHLPMTDDPLAVVNLIVRMSQASTTVFDVRDVSA